MKKHLVVAAISLAVMVGCTKKSESSTNNNNNNNNNNNVTCTGTKSFASDVSPIIQNVCAASGCHNTSSTNGPGPLTTYQQVFNARTSIRTAVINGTMPKNGSLSADQKNAIVCWIDNGAANN
jgi:hypothetical protein